MTGTEFGIGLVEFMAITGEICRNSMKLMFVAQVIVVRWAGYSHLACVLQRMRSEVHVCRTASFYI